MSNQVLAYADDIDLIGRSSVNVVESFLRLERAAKSIGKEQLKIEAPGETLSTKRNLPEGSSLQK